MSDNKNSTPPSVKAQHSKDSRQQKDDAQAEPQTAEPTPETDHLGATENAVVPITALTDDEENDDVDIDPADEITPG